MSQLLDKVLHRLDKRIESHCEALTTGQPQDFTQYKSTVSRVSALREVRDEIDDLVRRYAAGEEDDV